MKEKKAINVQIGNEIRKARELAGLTQEQFGEIMQLGTKNVSDIERGVVGISISTLKRICERLPVSSDTLLFGSDSLNDTSYLTENLREIVNSQRLPSVWGAREKRCYVFGGTAGAVTARTVCSSKRISKSNICSLCPIKPISLSGKEMMHFAFLFGEFTVPTTSGPVCPPVVGISNSPKMRGNHTMFPPGGHMGPPL